MPDGLLVYDQDRHEAHSLNQTAALVWRHCDGTMGVPEMAALLQREMNLPAEEAVVWLALDRLEKAHLLQNCLTRPADSAGISRRAIIRKIGLAGGLVALLPLVESLTAPKAAYAQSGDRGGAADCPGAGTNCQLGSSGNCGHCEFTGNHWNCVGPAHACV